MLGAFVGINQAGNSDEKLSVNEAIRVQHSQELLNNKKIESNELVIDVSDYIFAKLKEELPENYRYQARQIANAIIRESNHFELDPLFVLAMIKTESRFRPQIVGSHGEIGLMQVRPETAHWIARKYRMNWAGSKELFIPAENIRFGTAYVHYLRGKFNSVPSKYISAYNMGPRNVRELAAQAIEPREYAGKIMSNYENFYAQLKMNLGVLQAVR